MTFAFMADLHIGHYGEFDVNGSRLHRCLDAMRQVYQIAYGKKVSAIIDCGDLIDKKNQIDFSTYNPTFQTFDDLFSLSDRTQGKPKFHTLIGNHNMAKLTDPTVNNLVPLQHHIDVIDSPRIVTSYDYCGLLMAFIPYRRSLEQWWKDYATVCEMIEAYEPVHKVIGGHPMRKILVAHQEIKGAQPGTHRYVASGGVDHNMLPGPFDWCIFGHYHRAQFLSEKVFYCGAVLQQEFGEEGNAQGFWIYDPGPNTWEWQHIQSSHFFTIEDNPPDNFNFYRCRTTEEPEIKPVNARYEPIVVAEDATRLQVQNYGSPQDLINAYLIAKVPVERHIEILQLVNTL